MMDGIDPEQAAAMQGQTAANYPAEYMMPGMSSQNQSSDSAMIEKLDPSHLMNEIAYFLMGYTEIGEEWVMLKGSKPLVNNLGFNRIMFTARSVINNNTTSSDFKEEEIPNKIYFLAVRLINLLALNYEEFNIDKKNFDIIWENICDMSEAAMKRGKNRGEMKIYKTNIKSSENLFMAPKISENKRGGIWPFGKK